MNDVSQSRASPKRAAGAAVILLYHRIAHLRCDPWGLAVSPEHFAEHLALLRKFGEPKPLAQIVNAVQRGEPIAAPTLAVTFDDGYADNLYNAAPLLERYDVPATVFLTTGYVGAAREFWWDEAERILFSPEELPARLRLVVAGRAAEWPLERARYYLEEARLSDREWFRDRLGSPSPRYEFFQAVHRLLLSLGDAERRRSLDDLNVWAGDATSARQSHLCLSPEEVAALSRRELVEMGAHTVTHPSLPGLNEESQRRELRQSKLELEGLVGRRVTSFAYPYGQYAPETANLARQEGFSSACSTQAGAVKETSDLFALPRVKVGDWDGERLARTLAEWLPNEC